ncbi:MAG: tRNA lysidine(34) synthetase TilS [Oscillospiraceae bacterium]|jgi:tRNA(Ile)-lysidine synthase|nr:tRNA lysidine(34) synthetase TilS [Oscillospiraceae bacterium]
MRGAAAVDDITGAVAAFAASYGMLPRRGAVLACVSGGADSMCMLDILVRLIPDFGYTVEAVHFNHMLRGDESERDMAFVAGYCERAGIKHHAGRGDTAAGAARGRVGIEEAARDMRYAFFEEIAVRTDAAAIATAHTADDNAETVLFNLARGTGARGICGIPPVRGRIVRPMLCVTRRDVETYLLERGIPHVEDSTNLSDDYARNRLRRGVMPVLRTVNSAAAENILRASELSRSDDDFLRAEARRFISDCPDDGRAPVRELLALHPSVAARAIRALAGVSLTREHVRAVLDLCRRGSPSGEACLPGGVSAFREYEYIMFAPSGPPRVFEPVELAPGVAARPEGAGILISCEDGVCCDKINKSLTTFMFDKSKICGKLTARPRGRGDTINILAPNGKLSGTKTLKKLFIERRIPARARSAVPVIADEAGPLAVVGVGRGARCIPSPGDKVIIVRSAAVRREPAAEI